MIALICGKTTKAKRWPEVAPSTTLASIVSGLIADSAAITRTTVNGICVQTWATVIETKASRGSVSQSIELSISPSLKRSALMIPQLGWNTQVHSTALIAPGSTQGRRMIERSTVDAEEIAIEEERDRPCR